MPEIESRRKKPGVIRMLLWDNTNFEQIDDFAGDDGCGNRNVMLDCGQLRVWNDQEQAWFAVPVGHRVTRGVLGELYGLSPKAYTDTTEPATEVTGKTMGQVLHESLQESAAAESDLPAGSFATWDQVRQSQRDRLEGIARDLIAAYVEAGSRNE